MWTMAWMLACRSPDTDLAGAQLEAVSVAAQGVDPYEEATASGTATVTGADGDWTLALAGDAPATLTVHSPGRSDLSTLDGRALEVELLSSDLDGQRSVVVSDPDGVAWVADVGFDGGKVDELFGAGFVGYGATAGTARDESYDWTYTSAVFASDDGPVELLPGEVGEVVKDGVHWRAAVIAAYRVQPRPHAELPCGGIGDLLSYELLRVDAAPEPMVLTRAAGRPLAHEGCL